MKEITFKTDNRGKKRAYYFARQQFRWFPMPLREAEGLIASGAAVFVPLHKTLLTPGGRTVSEGRHPESEGGTMASAQGGPRWLFHINTHYYVDRSDPAHSREIVVEAPTAEEALGKLYAWREGAGELGPMIGTGKYKYVGMIHDQSEATTKRATQGMASASTSRLCRRQRPTSRPWDRAVAMLDKARTMKQLNAAYEKARIYLLENAQGNEHQQIWCEYNSRIGNVTG